MKKFFLSLILALVTVPLFSQEQEEIIEQKTLIQRLADQNIQSTPWDDGDWWDEDDFAIFVKKYLASLQNPHPRFKRSSAFKMLKQVDWNTSFCSLDDESVWTDLDLFVGRRDKSAYVAAKVDRTQTELGKGALYALLAHPTFAVEATVLRQSIIRVLSEDRDLFSTLESLFKESEMVEGLIFSLFNQNVLKNSSRHCYFQGALSKANNSSVALQIRSLFEHGRRTYGTISCGIAAAVLLGYGLSQLINVANPWLDQKALEYKNDAGYGVRLLWPIFTHPMFRGLLALGGSALCAEFTYENARWEYGCTVLELALQTIVISVGKHLGTLISIARLVANCPEFVMCEDLKPLFDLLDLVEREDGEIAELFGLLSNQVALDEATMFSLQGQTLRAFKIFYDLKERFITAMVAGAKLDALMSCARLIAESKNNRAGYSFATFCQQPTPFIQAEGVWHPFIKPEHVIAHDFVLGGHNAARNMIITGPNEGGKSTVLKEISIALIMAQSLGIVPAKKFVVTPFSTISTYLTAVDDAGAGNSLFRASAVRAGQLLDRIENACEGNFVFAAFDELFNGTSSTEGEAAAYSVVKEIGASAYVISLVATHFPKLTTLVDESKNFMNYKVMIDVQPDGSIGYPYRLEPGISNQHVALHVLQSQGISHRFLNDAIAQLQH